MMKLFSRICAVVLIVLGTAALCHAQTAYVSDMLILTLRQGPGSNYPVITTLKSDTPLTIIDEKNGYCKVSLTSGDQGWVDKKFIVTDPPKSIIIDQLKKEKAALENKISELMESANKSQHDRSQTDNNQKAEIAANQAAMAQLEKENQTLTQNIETLKSQYAALRTASADIETIVKENKRLKTQNDSLNATLTQKKENEGLMFKTGMIKWFLAGVGVLLLGWLIGLSLSSRQGRSGSLLD
ncbi:TIGR04211 family SH3 domain-containing protein [uncultured Desulfobacter sp.]|uniref:TIGR04211 family SH3 domain-containing protein n=1 Tax=uncultured Desulfobacter sp. TaxID=240139 RepID=UPI002AAB8662|nr:TIGR04211 family SH3 domain-containing protein [uncultured Desulfobacter sp.]